MTGFQRAIIYSYIITDINVSFNDYKPMGIIYDHFLRLFTAWPWSYLSGAQ
jgi:hypothetical protein